MSLPEIESCVLRTLADADFKEVMGKPVGEYSLLEDIRSTHADLFLGQQLPPTSTYPTFVVCDLTPATRGILTDEVTLIVMPPLDSKQPPLDLDALKAEASARTHRVDCVGDATVAGEVEFEIRLQRELTGRRAETNSRVLDELLVPEGAVLCFGNEPCACYFALHLAPDLEDAAWPSWAIRVSPELFRDIRAAFLYYVSYPVESYPFSATSFTVPIHQLTPLEDEEGNVEIFDSPLRKDSRLRLDKLVLCPAFHNFVLCNIFGESYADLMELVLALSTRKLHGRLLTEGDVVTLQLTQEDLQRCPHHISGFDVLEAVFATLKHQTETFSGVWVSPDMLSLFPFRVVELWRGNELVRCGCAWYGDGEESGQHMGLSLVSQAMFKAKDCTPLFAPVKADDSEHDRLTFQQRLDSALKPCLEWNGGHGAGSQTFVVHGLKENGACSFIEQALWEFGVPSMCASAEGLDDEELKTLLEKFGQTPGQVALIVKNAENISFSYPELLPLLQLPAAPENPGYNGCPRMIFLVCETQEPVPPVIGARATNAEGVLTCGNPSEEDRERLARQTARRATQGGRIHQSPFLSFRALATWTVGLTCADIVAYMQLCMEAVMNHDYPADVVPVLSSKVCEQVLQGYLKSHGLTLVSTNLQPVRWSDVGGLVEAKQELKDTIQLPILYPELFENGMKKRTGILFYGPPGCGKTLLARAVATEMNMNFMSVKGPELINQYVGESERNIRVLFQKARDNSPCIIFFDELDALAPARGAKGDAGGAMDRIVSQLLVEVDGIGQSRSDGSESGDVFIIGATNRPDLLDASLLRPGRFDRLCYLGIPSTKEQQLQAVRALTRKFNLADDVDLEKLLEPLDFVYTGADFFALCSDAMMFSVQEALESMNEQAAASLDAKQKDDAYECSHHDNNNNEATPQIRVKMCHFLQARAQLKPSVTKEDLRRYESLKTKFSS